jgi:hypothetical protein
MKLKFATALLLLAPFASQAADVAAPLPAMYFYSSIANNDLYDVVKGDPLFKSIDREIYGSPLALRVTHSLSPTAGGKAAGVFSALWAGGTLGILPVVTNNEFVVNYEIMVHSKVISTFTYRRAFTRSVNIWANNANDATHGLGKAGFEWLKSTAAEFAAAAAHDERLAQLQQEYESYFGAIAH